MLDLLTIIFAAALSLQSSGTQSSLPPPTDEARSQIIDTGAPAQAQNSPDVDYTRAVIIDTGQQ